LEIDTPFYLHATSGLYTVAVVGNAVKVLFSHIYNHFLSLFVVWLLRYRCPVSDNQVVTVFVCMAYSLSACVEVAKNFSVLLMVFGRTLDDVISVVMEFSDVRLQGFHFLSRPAPSLLATRDFQEGVGFFPQEGFGDSSPTSKTAAWGSLASRQGGGGFTARWYALACRRAYACW